MSQVEANIDTVIIFTQNMDELARFYQEAFALGEPQNVQDDHIGFVLPSLYLGFDQVDWTPGERGGVSLWFRVDDVNGTYERCLELGATTRYAPVTKPMGERLASLFDPEGNLIGISERTT